MVYFCLSFGISFEYSFCPKDGRKKEGNSQRREQEKGNKGEGAYQSWEVNLANTFQEILLLSHAELIKLQAFQKEEEGKEAERNIDVLPWDVQNPRLSREKLMSESSEMQDYIL